MDEAEFELQTLILVEEITDAAMARSIAVLRARGVELTPEQYAVGRAAARACAEAEVAKL